MSEYTYYIAGPMAGFKEHNRPAFYEAENYLHLGVGVSRERIANPARLDGTDDGKSWEACLARDLEYVLAAEQVLALPGWERSRGATLEVLVARLLGKFVVPYHPEKTWGARFDSEVTRLQAIQAFVQTHMPQTHAETVLEEANRLIHGDRQGSYRHPLDNFKVIGDLWGAILLGALESNGFGLVGAEQPDGMRPLASHFSVLPETVGLMMAALKLGREAGNHKRDNLVDAAGYAGTVAMIHDERARRRGEG